ncbi:MAG: hypothetical protein KDC71_02725 [Acidobacteria bacterium]|nr:hypothetical protein [Acidobacteriota bacterium]
MDNAIKEGYCNFARVGDGRSQFARIRIHLSTMRMMDPGNHSQVPMEWQDAAGMGAVKALELLGKPQWHNKIVELMGTDADTSPDTVWCAAVLAILDAFALKDDHVTFSKAE